MRYSGGMNAPPSGQTLLAAPGFAWPTLAVFILALGGWSAAAWLGATGQVPTWAAIALGAVAAYLTFTPLHEAIHRAVCRAPWLNEGVGRLAALPLFSPFIAVRRLHLEHHRHTNDAEHDPDYWSGRGPWLLRPLRWATQDLHYYARLLRAWGSLPRAERVELVLNLMVLLGACGALTWSGYGNQVLLFGVLPARLAITFLAYSFDYLPHRPHQVTAAENRYRATHVVDSRVLEVLLLGQCFHLVHHLYPAVPFYRYRQVWVSQRAELVARGVEPG